MKDYQIDCNITIKFIKNWIHFLESDIQDDMPLTANCDVQVLINSLQSIKDILNDEIGDN